MRSIKPIGFNFVSLTTYLIACGRQVCGLLYYLFDHLNFY